MYYVKFYFRCVTFTFISVFTVNVVLTTKNFTCDLTKWSYLFIYFAIFVSKSTVKKEKKNCVPLNKILYFHLGIIWSVFNYLNYDLLRKKNL